jgi:MYXO-CTERM domain-containing protein
MWSNGNESTRQLPGYLSVTTVAVPAPGAVALLGLAGLAGRGRRRR